MQVSKYIQRAAFTAVVAGTLGFGSTAFADVIYNNIPSTLPGNVPSLGYQATQTAQFGDMITFAAGPRSLTNVTITMSDWALESSYETVGTSAGFYVPLTLTLYNIGGGNSVGSTIASRTLNSLIPWRPEASAGCGTAWSDGNGNCFNGLAFNVQFDFSGVIVPNSIIYGLAFNTQTWGASPIGVDGPYNSLNFGLSDSLPGVGTDTNTDGVYWNTSTAGWYADGGAGGVGTFRQDTAWSDPYYSPMSRFEATAPTDVPEPASLVLMGLGLAGIGLRRRKVAA